MRTGRIELMHEHVRAVHRSVTGRELPEAAPPENGERKPPTVDELEQRFAELQAAVRSIPALAERIPPFSFEPPLDVIGTERELMFELGVPGIERGDVAVELVEGALIVRGARPVAANLDGRVYLHAEIARGPFFRALSLPEGASGPPRVEVENGIIRVKLARAIRAPLPRA
jgi:HSP20 family molecular chaperone IbpA